jgi:hypothetical protein
LNLRIFLSITIASLAIIFASCASAPQSDSTMTSTSSGTVQTTSSLIVPSTSTQTAPVSQIEANAIVSLVIDSQMIKSGDVFSANLLIDSRIALRGIQWKLSFNPAVLRCDKVTEGNYFRDWASSHGGNTVTFPKPVIDNTAGQISDMGIAIMSNQAGGPLGKGIACVYSFTALADFPGIPSLYDVQVVDSNAGMVKALVK